MSKLRYHVTRTAFLALREIYAYSLKQWGMQAADNYVADIYTAFEQISKKPANLPSRRHRAAPFHMVPVRQHFIVYDFAPKAVVILTLLHQRRSIETIVANMEPAFHAEIKTLRKNFID